MPLSSRPRLGYDDPEPYPRGNPTSTDLLREPQNSQRPRSLPPTAADKHRLRRRRPRSRSRSHSSSRSSLSSRYRSPVSKARHAVKNTFSDSPSGIGVGILGAIVGGLVAYEASNVTAKAWSDKAHDHDDRCPSSSSKNEHQKTRRLATLAGAVAGGLGANAIEKKFEEARDRDRERQETWEKKWGKEDHLPHYDSGRPSRRDYDLGDEFDERDDDHEYVNEGSGHLRRRSDYDDRGRHH